MQQFGDLELVTTNFGCKAKLYFESNLFYPHRVDAAHNGSWICVGCKFSVKTDDGRVVKKSEFAHYGHDQVCRDEVLCLAMLNNVKQRVHDEPDKVCKLIFDGEIADLQKVHGMSEATVCTYLKPYRHYKTSFEFIRARVRPALSLFDDFDANIDQMYTVTTEGEPFLRYDHKEAGNRMLIFASDFGIRELGKATRWQADGKIYIDYHYLNKY